MHPGQNRPSVTYLRDGCVEKGRVVFATVKTILDARVARSAEVTRPLSVGLARYMACGYDMRPGWTRTAPDEESIVGEEGAVVVGDPCPARDSRGGERR